MGASDVADFFAAALAHLSDARPFIPMYIHLILSALFPIYTGAHASLSKPSSAADPTGASEDGDTDEEDEDDTQHMEGLSNSDAIILPLTAGIVLAGLYFLIKTYGADIINLILGWYFSLVSMYSVTKLVNDTVLTILSLIYPTYYAQSKTLWRVDGRQRQAIQHGVEDGEKRSSPLPGIFGQIPVPQSLNAMLWSIRQISKQKYTLSAYVATILDSRANITLINVLSALVGTATVAYANMVSKLWFLTNLQGFAVSYGALQLLSPTKFITGSLILGALFCYDIWAVFFTPLMITVAKNLDQPIKLMFPRPDEPGATPEEPPVKNFSMLGLGDIVVPGIMIGLALRFDLYLFYLKKQKKVPVDSKDSLEKEEVMQKARYISPTRTWSDRIWTTGLSPAKLPEHIQGSFPKPYFTSSMAGYVTGLITTVGVMSIFKHAQPALLYLVPSVLISLWGTALFRGEVAEMCQYTEAITAEQLSDDGEKQEKEQSASTSTQQGIFQRLWAELFGVESPTGKQGGERDPESDAKPTGEGKPEGVPLEKQTPDLLISFSVSKWSSKGASKASVGSESVESKPKAKEVSDAASSTE